MTYKEDLVKLKKTDPEKHAAIMKQEKDKKDKKDKKSKKKKKKSSKKEKERKIFEARIKNL